LVAAPAAASQQVGDTGADADAIKYSDSALASTYG
jgi:hypothetical protein